MNNGQKKLNKGSGGKGKTDKKTGKQGWRENKVKGVRNVNQRKEDYSKAGYSGKVGQIEEEEELIFRKRVQERSIRVLIFSWDSASQT